VVRCTHTCYQSVATVEEKCPNWLQWKDLAPDIAHALGAPIPSGTTTEEETATDQTPADRPARASSGTSAGTSAACVLPRPCVRTTAARRKPATQSATQSSHRASFCAAQHAHAANPTACAKTVEAPARLSPCPYSLIDCRQATDRSSSQAHTRGGGSSLWNLGRRGHKGTGVIVAALSARVVCTCGRVEQCKWDCVCARMRAAWGYVIEAPALKPTKPASFLLR
jgi:hypothetical protein